MSKNLSGQQTGMSPGTDLNNNKPANYRGLNQFPQSFPHATTDKYGVYQPFFHVKCERGDIQNLATFHDLHTYTMKSPMVGDVTLTKSFVKVPMEAIYPRNWRRMFTIPTRGSDVPSDIRALFDVRKCVDNCVKFINSFMNREIPISDSNVRHFFDTIWLLELICSHGSLFERFNIHLGFTFSSENQPDPVSIDKFLDLYFYPKLLGSGYYLLDSNDIRYFVRNEYDYNNTRTTKYVSPARFIELFHNPDIRLGDGFITDELPDEYPDFAGLVIDSGYTTLGAASDIEVDNYRYLNIEPIVAYQLACAQFATRDTIDFVYDASIWRDNMQGLYYYIEGTDEFPTYSYNGVSYQYDVVSQSVLDFAIDRILDSEYAVSFLINLFEYWNSLRYGDYFTGSKPSPLAIGDYAAEVVDDSVNAIEIARSLQFTRLAHHAVMSGPKYDDYIADIFGGEMPDAPKDVPVFLAHQYFKIDGFETNNTGEAQLDKDVPNTITTHLRSAESKHSFEVKIAEPCYIIGMSSYMMQRLYSKTIDAFAFHHDRYDDFLPELQFIGDQTIKRVELDCNDYSDQPFAYVGRNMEYKIRYGYVSGGFVENLPSWAFVTDNEDGNTPETYITPDYIRSSPSEFDRFYKSLSGYSLGSRFHFIICHQNYTAPYRMMEVKPQILK